MENAKAAAWWTVYDVTASFEEGGGALKNEEYAHKATTEMKAAVIMMPTVKTSSVFTAATRLPTTNPIINERTVNVFSAIVRGTWIII